MNYKKRKFFSDRSSWHSIENEENSDESGSENFGINLEFGHATIHVPVKS